MLAEQFSYRFIFSLLSALLTFSRSLFVSKERKGCNVSIVLSTGSCVSGSSRKRAKDHGYFVWAMLSGCHGGRIKCSFFHN